VRIKKYSVNKRRHKGLAIIIILVLVAVIVAGGAFGVKRYYNEGLQPVSTSQKYQLVTIASGSTLKGIANQLQNQKLIRNALVFEEYASTQGSKTQLEAGTYELSPSMTVQEIVSILSRGKTATSLVTILPGRTIEQIKADFINDGFTPQSVDAAMDPSQYQDVPVFAFAPNATTLEGLLYPDSFQKTPDTDPSVIIRASLTEMGNHITPSIQSAFAAEGLSVYKGITLASIVEREVSKPADQQQVAQVFLLRIKQGMKLESNVTAIYASNVGDPSYNTYNIDGLPPAPIATVEDNALNAVAHPASTNYLYFVTGKDGVTRYASTIDGQNANIQQYGNGDQ
jgi:UPF0755 protein